MAKGLDATHRVDGQDKDEEIEDDIGDGHLDSDLRRLGGAHAIPVLIPVGLPFCVDTLVTVSSCSNGRSRTNCRVTAARSNLRDEECNGPRDDEPDEGPIAVLEPRPGEDATIHEQDREPDASKSQAGKGDEEVVELGTMVRPTASYVRSQITYLGL